MITLCPLWPPGQFEGPKWDTCKAHMHASLSQYRRGESEQWPRENSQKSARGGAAAPESSLELLLHCRSEREKALKEEARLERRGKKEAAPKPPSKTLMDYFRQAKVRCTAAGRCTRT